MNNSHDSDKPGSEQRLPGSVSNQNGEEAEPGHGQSAAAGQDAGKQSERAGHHGGEAGEGSQSTGNRNSAG